MKLWVYPLSLRDARQLVTELHRHHAAPQGGKFAIGLKADGDPVGCIIVGRPVARGADDGYTAEAVRVAVIEGIPNACSMLYRAGWRAAKAMGYLSMITYTRTDEPGISLRAAGFQLVKSVAARSWDTPSRPRTDKDERVDRFLWQIP
jgi:hypothetical protein